MSSQLRYHPCMEQRALAETFNDSIQALLPLDRLHRAPQESDETWAQLEAIGLFSIALGEAAGGSGLGAAEEALIVMQLGRCLAAPSVLATIGATHAPGAAMGRTAAGYRHGNRVVVAHDAAATRLLLRDGDSASVRAERPSGQAIDGGLWHVRLDEVSAAAEDGARFDAPGLLRLRLGDAAALAGIAALAVDLGVAHARERRQFGRPIGSFQAIKHHCADMAIAARNACDQVAFAAVAIDQARADAALQVDCALLVAATAALRNSAANIQIHGGIGFSEEAHPHLLLKRSQLLIALAGGVESTRTRIAAACPASAT